MSNTEKIFKNAEILTARDEDKTVLENALKLQGIKCSLFSDNSNDEGIPADIIICSGDNTSKRICSAWEKARANKAILISSKESAEDPNSIKLLHMVNDLNKTIGLSLSEKQNKESPFYSMSEKELLEILYRKEFELWYQPVMHGVTEKIAGFEALIRWRNPKTGEIVFPDRFIPHLENIDFIIPFGFWIIEEKCRQLSEWKTITGDYPIRITINLSARQFTCPELVDRITGIINCYNINPQSIALEITESALMEDMRSANIMLLTLKSKNIPLYLDDFGTGFSSLSYLMHFPMNTIKIDKSFVTWMHVDEQSEEIVRSIITLGHNLKMTVVAEGVEYPEHIEMLRSMGCDYFQGYFYAKPLCAKDAEKFLKENM
jgi:EAL domain-containing protein (putative c-di-GMP-specific phosphodiesterase class I)